VKSPRRERPSSDAFAGSFGLGIEVVFDRLTDHSVADCASNSPSSVAV
jgi:hypothetical protein